MVQRTRLRGNSQVQNSRVYDDVIANAHVVGTAEPTPLSSTLEHDLNIVRTQFKDLKGMPNWFDQIPDGYNLVELAGFLGLDASVEDITGTSFSDHDTPRFVVDGYSIEKSIAVLDNLIYDSFYDPTSPQFVTLQKVYDNSISSTGLGSITLTTGDFQVFDDDNASVFFRIDADTGLVEITGDLLVHGQTTTVNSTVTDADHMILSPASGATTALKIEPDTGVTYTTDLVQIFNKYELDGGTKVFRVENDGGVIAGSLTPGGLYVDQDGFLGTQFLQVDQDFRVDGTADFNVTDFSAISSGTLRLGDANSSATGSVDGTFLLSTLASDFSSNVRAAAGVGLGTELGIIDAINAVSAQASGGGLEKAQYWIVSSDPRITSTGGGLANNILDIDTADYGSLELGTGPDGYDSSFMGQRDLEVYLNGQLLTPDFTQKTAGQTPEVDYFLASDDLSKIVFSMELEVGDIIVIKNYAAASGENRSAGWAW